MGRPSKKEERTEEILQAFQRCVASYGIEGSTLERIAEEAGLKRSLVRHFVGNREELVQKLADRVINQSNQQWAEFIAWLPADNPVPVLLEGLFSEEHSDPESVLVLESLIFAAGRDPDLQQRMQRWMSVFTDDIARVLKQAFPEADEQALASVSYGLTSLYFNLDSLAPLDMSSVYRQPARQAADILISHLKRLDSSGTD